MKTFIFPGQGSQKKGMGAYLFDEFESETINASEVLGYSIKELCLNDSNNNLAQTQFTQPALFFVNALYYLKKIKVLGCLPDFVVGHSLGEYNALFAAGAFDLTTGLKLVKKRGELMSHANNGYNGGMAAIIGGNETLIRNVLDDNRLSTVDIANYNSPNQFVISGEKDCIEKAKHIFDSIKDVKLYSILKVSAAFHSRYMNNAAIEFNAYLQQFDFSPISIPVISNYSAKPYFDSSIKELLVNQINNSVKWIDCITYLLNVCRDMHFEEIGESKVLTKLVNEIKNDYSFRLKEDTENNIIAKNKPVECSAEERSQNSTVSEHENVRQHNDGTIHERKFQILRLGNDEFMKEYNLAEPYLVGGMYKGIASVEMVIKMAQSKMLGFLGTGGLTLEQIEKMIIEIKQNVYNGKNIGVNILYDYHNKLRDGHLVDLCLKYNINTIEAAAYLNVTKSLVKYHAKGLRLDKRTGKILRTNKIVAKISRPEIAEIFLSPAPESIVMSLFNSREITWDEVEMSKKVAVADCLCVEADSGGHTDAGVAYTLMPAMIELKNVMMEKYKYDYSIYIGAAGGIGTPESAAAAFILGADFILTGSINQCTVEANTSDVVKDLLQNMNVQDTEYAPAGDMFEFGSKVQVLKRGVLFPVRANKLYDLYKNNNSIDEIDEKTRVLIEEKYFKHSFDEIYEYVKKHHSIQTIETCETNGKIKMALIFKWYFMYSTDIALKGVSEDIVNFQIHCGPALGAFNQWVKGTDFEHWRQRHVDDIGKLIIAETKKLLSERMSRFI